MTRTRHWSGARQKSELHDIVGSHSAVAQSANGQLAVALGETTARGVRWSFPSEFMVRVLRTSQQFLQKAMDVGRRPHVFARHQRNALQMIVDDNGDMIAGRRVLAGDHEVADQPRLALDAAPGLVEE